MTSDGRFEQDLPDLMAQLAPRRVPDYRDDVVRLSARTRQRRAWTFPERWLPVDITLAPARGRPRSLVGLIAFAIVGLLIAGTLAIYVGSRPAPVPAPFGLAANGALFYDANGAIVAIDTLESTPRTVVQGAEPYTYPLPSRDGRLLMFDHTTNGTSTIYVSDVDGSNVHPLSGTYTGWTETDWSPDGEHLAVLSTIEGMPSLSVLATDGSSAKTLALGRDVAHFWYMADGRIAFTGSETPGVRCQPGFPANVCALFVVDPSGGDPRRILSAAAYMGISMQPMPDGRHIAFVRWDPSGEPGGIHLVDVATGIDQRVPVDGVASATENTNQLRVSPDGSQILFDWLGETESQWAVVPVAGGAAVRIGPPFSDHPDGMDAEVAFSPDGASILASYPQMDGSIQYWLLDSTGKTPGKQVSLPASYVPAWQRRADS